LSLLNTISIASRIPNSGYGIINEHSTKTTTSVLVINYEVLHQGPRASTVREVGYNEQHHGADNLALIFCRQQLMPRASTNLCEDPSAVIGGRTTAQLYLGRGDSQFAVELQDAWNILLGSESNRNHLLGDLLAKHE